MSPKESPTSSPPPTFNAGEFAKFGQKQADAFLGMQREFFSVIEQANRDWAVRAELEREMAAELAAKLSSAKTLPDAAKAYQEWMGRRLATLTEDGQKFLADSQKLVTSATRLFANGGQGSGT